ncbi:MAG: hypothetical protein ABW001_04515 [Mycobacterium sp.]
MIRAAVGAPLLLHLGREDMALTRLQLLAHPAVVSTELHPVAVVELLDTFPTAAIVSSSTPGDAGPSPRRGS